MFHGEQTNSDQNRREWEGTEIFWKLRKSLEFNCTDDIHRNCRKKVKCFRICNSNGPPNPGQVTRPGYPKQDYLLHNECFCSSRPQSKIENDKYEYSRELKSWRK